MAVTITHSTLADGTFSATGAAAWDATHTVSGLGTMAEQNSNNVNITGGSITGVTGVLSSLTVNSTPTSGGAAGQIMFDTGSVLQESADLVWDNVNDFLQIKNNAGAYQLGASSDVILTRRGAANLRFGAADAAAPIAQTLSVQSVVAGTSNTAGANLTITGSQGTGTGAGGSIIFRVAPAGTTGTAQNALTTFATIAPTGTGGSLTLTGGTLTASQPVLDMTQTWNNVGTTFTGLRFNVTNTASNGLSRIFDFQVGGSSMYRGDVGGAFSAIGPSVSANNFAGIYISQTGQSNSQLAMAFQAGVPALFFGPSSSAFDLFLTRRGAANLRFGAADAAAPVAQTLSVQSVVAGTSNTAGANFTITGSQGTGTGAGGSIIFQTADVGASGTAQNTLVTALRIYSNQTVAVGKAYTVATLPAAGTQGRRAWVTDATAPTFLGALTGGGAVVCPVFDNGTAWVAG